MISDTSSKGRDQMHTMTERNLHEAFAGESQAHMKYLIYADKADHEKFPEVARLFRAIASAERIHATNHWRALEMIKTSKDNVQNGIDGEHYEITEMYPTFNAVAELQQEKGAVRSTLWALETEKIHEGMYIRAKEALASGRDASFGKIYICPVCGYTMEGDAPDICPICKAKKSTFKEF
jgi:rubrerythrin